MTFELKPRVPELRFIQLVEPKPDALVMSATFSAIEAVDYRCFCAALVAFVIQGRGGRVGGNLI